jgi:ATP-dependent DNA helicase RecQ
MCDNCRIKQKDLVDITIPAQMFLSCVKRTGECFGAGHAIGVLRGSKSQKVFKNGYDKLSTYGIGTMYSAKQWRHLFRQLIHKGLVIQELEHGTLKLTKKAWEVLRGKETVMGRLEERRVDLKHHEEDQRQYDPALFELLRRKRKKIADEANLPPFTIFHDRTLKEMAIHFPQSRESLSMIYGVGAAKIEKYGHIFLKIVRLYCETHQLT